MLRGTFAKLKDDTWGARVVGEAEVCVGDTLTMTSKAGNVTQRTVTRVLWNGLGRDGQPATLVALDGDADSPTAAQSPRPRTAPTELPRETRGGSKADDYTEIDPPPCRDEHRPQTYEYLHQATAEHLDMAL